MTCFEVNQLSSSFRSLKAYHGVTDIFPFHFFFLFFNLQLLPLIGPFVNFVHRASIWIKYWYSKKLSLFLMTKIWKREFIRNAPAHTLTSACVNEQTLANPGCRVWNFLDHLLLFVIHLPFRWCTVVILYSWISIYILPRWENILLNFKTRIVRKSFPYGHVP